MEKYHLLSTPLGRFINSHRNNQSWHTIATECGIDQYYLDDVLSGRRMPSAAVVMAIADYFQISRTELLEFLSGCREEIPQIQSAAGLERAQRTLLSIPTDKEINRKNEQSEFETSHQLRTVHQSPAHNRAAN